MKSVVINNHILSEVILSQRVGISTPKLEQAISVLIDWFLDKPYYQHYESSKNDMKQFATYNVLTQLMKFNHHLYGEKVLSYIIQLIKSSNTRFIHKQRKLTTGTPL